MRLLTHHGASTSPREAKSRMDIWLVLLMVVATLTLGAEGVGSAGTRERRQASGCFWWKGECDDKEIATQPPPQPANESVSVRDRDFGVSQQQQPQLQHPQQQQQQQQEYSSCDNHRGVCVAYYLCQENSIITDGAGIIDIRFAGQKDNKTRSNSECHSYLDVCCRNPLPPTTPTPAPTPYRSNCGTRNSQGIDIRIQGFKDNQAQFAEFPWMAAILKKEVIAGATKNLYVCGGSLIHPSLVLTTAHCVAKLGVGQITVRLGEWDTQRNYEPYPYHDRGVGAIVIHPEYNRQGALYNDYALLYLDAPADLSYNVDTICLGTSYDPKSCLVTGWGKDKFGKDGVYQNVLKKVDLPLWEDRQCQRALRTSRLGRYFNLHRSFVCAGGEAGKDSCSGDGGSPLVCLNPSDGKYVQVGMVAWGIGCGTQGIPGVYADVPFGYNWIVAEADNLLRNTPGYDNSYWRNGH